MMMEEYNILKVCISARCKCDYHIHVSCNDKKTKPKNLSEDLMMSVNQYSIKLKTAKIKHPAAIFLK